MIYFIGFVASRLSKEVHHSEVLYKVTATSDILPEGSLYISHRKVRVLIIVETLFPRKINHKRNKKIDYVILNL